jgi:hypothetical protein
VRLNCKLFHTLAKHPEVGLQLVMSILSSLALQGKSFAELLGLRFTLSRFFAHIIPNLTHLVAKAA